MVSGHRDPTVYCGLSAASPQEDHKVSTSSNGTKSHKTAPFPLSLTVTDSQSRVGGSGSTSRVQGLHRPTRTVTADDHDAERRTVGRPRRADAVHEWPPDGPVTRLGRRVDAGHFTALPTPPGCSATVPSSPAGYERCRGVESPRSRPGTTQREPLHP